MSSAVKGILLGITAILVGTGIVISWFMLGTSGNSAQPGSFSQIGPDVSRVSMCDIMEDPVGFDSRQLEFDAVAYLDYDGTIMLNPDHCLTKTQKLMTYPQLSNKTTEGPNSRLKTLLEDSSPDTKRDIKEVKVKITGVAHSIDYDGIKTYAIEPTNIDVVETN
jgi:hypothetical protein